MAHFDSLLFSFLKFNVRNVWWQEELKDFSVQFQSKWWTTREKTERGSRWGSLIICYTEHFNHRSRAAVMKHQCSASSTRACNRVYVDETPMAWATNQPSPHARSACRGKESVNRTLPRMVPLRLSVMKWGSCETFVSEASPLQNSILHKGSSPIIRETPDHSGQSRCCVCTHLTMHTIQTISFPVSSWRRSNQAFHPHLVPRWKFIPIMRLCKQNYVHNIWEIHIPTCAFATHTPSRTNPFYSPLWRRREERLWMKREEEWRGDKRAAHNDT